MALGGRQKRKCERSRGRRCSVHPFSPCTAWRGWDPWRGFHHVAFNRRLGYRGGGCDNCPTRPTVSTSCGTRGVGRLRRETDARRFGSAATQVPGRRRARPAPRDSSRQTARQIPGVHASSEHSPATLGPTSAATSAASCPGSNGKIVAGPRPGATVGVVVPGVPPITGRVEESPPPR